MTFLVQKLSTLYPLVINGISEIEQQLAGSDRNKPAVAGFNRLRGQQEKDLKEQDQQLASMA
jgi:hypothetical protein